VPKEAYRAYLERRERVLREKGLTGHEIDRTLDLSGAEEDVVLEEVDGADGVDEAEEVGESDVVVDREQVLDEDKAAETDAPSGLARIEGQSRRWNNDLHGDAFYFLSRRAGVDDMSRPCG
jgi:hypothetical protein